MRRLEIGLTLLLVMVVVVGLQTVGVVLIVATLITPAAAARQWTDRLGAMVLLAAAIGAGSGVAGSLASATLPRMPTGPVIVLASSAVLVVSLLFAPRRGLLWAYLRERAVAERIRRENLLKDLYRLGEAGWGLAGLRHPAAAHGGARPDRRAARRQRPAAGAGRAAGGRRRHPPPHPRGLLEAEQVVRKHRLWELYLTRRLELPSDHVHRDAEAMEHALSDQAVAELDEALGFPASDPHGRPIPPARTAG